MTALWIKICGMTTAAAVEAALAAGVDAIGFVFAASPRRVTVSQANELAAPARGKLRCIAVTRQPDPAVVATLLSDFMPDVLQTDHEDLAHLTLPDSLEVLPVLRAGSILPASLPPPSGAPCATRHGVSVRRHAGG